LPAGQAGDDSQQVDRALEDARGLLQDRRLDESIVTLRGVLARLERMRELETRQSRLADGCFELGLAYLALREREPARETLKSALLLDPRRHLSPTVYNEEAVRLLAELRTDLGLQVGTQPSVSSSTQGTLSVVSDAWLYVSVDGGPPRQTPFSVFLAAGPHRLRAQREGYREQVIDVDVVDGETARVTIELSRLDAVP